MIFKGFDSNESNFNIVDVKGNKDSKCKQIIHKSFNCF